MVFFFFGGVDLCKWQESDCAAFTEYTLRRQRINSGVQMLNYDIKCLLNGHKITKSNNNP